MSSYLLNKAKELVQADEFGSVSDVISTAVSQFIFMHDQAQRDDKLQFPSVSDYVTDAGELIENMINEYLRSPEGKAIIRSIIRESLTPHNESLKKKPVVIYTEEYTTNELP